MSNPILNMLINEMYHYNKNGCDSGYIALDTPIWHNVLNCFRYLDSPINEKYELVFDTARLNFQNYKWNFLDDKNDIPKILEWGVYLKFEKVKPEEQE
jgi:uncharacterized protein (UPF0371 family)